MTDDANSLFERNSVDELQGILLKIKGEADKKKYDLRRLVGASYKDVIDAANAIGSMKSCSQILVNQLLATEGLNETQSLMPLKNDESKKSDPALLCTAAKVRLLLITPEQIWNSMEKSDYLNAAYLYVISRLVYSSLSDVNSNFPIARDLWDSISPLKLQIAEKASQNVMSAKLSSIDLCSSLYALGILKDFTLQDLFHLFLDIRRQKILANISLGVSSDADIVNHLFEFVSCMKQTYKDIHDFFFIPQFSDFLKSDSIIHGLTPSLFSKMYSGISNISVLFRYLPDSAKHFSKFLKGGPPLSSTYVLNFSSIWLSNMKKSIEERLAILLGHIKTGGILASIQQNFSCFPETSMIAFTNEENNLHILNNTESIWNTYFKGLLFERSKSITEATFIDLFSSLKLEITRQTSDYINNSEFQNLEVEIWTKGLDEAQISNAHNTNFLVSPGFLQLDKKIKNSIEQCISEVLPLLEIHNAKSFSDLAHLHFSSALENFEKQMKDMIVEIEKKSDLIMKTKVEMCLFIGKALSTLSGRLSEFQKIFGAYFEQDQAKISFKGLILLSRKLWIESFVLQFSIIIKDGLKSTDWSECLAFIHLWEDVHISNLPFQKSPIHPSLFISKALFYICEEINRIDGFSIEKFCNSSYIDAIIESFLKDYSATIPILSVSTNGYIQMYFDVAYVLMTLRVQTVKFQDMDKSLLDLLLSKFKKGGNDALLEASLVSHVEKARSQHNSLYNLLIVNPAIIGTSSKSISEKKHMLLSLSIGVPRFNLLPIPTPALTHMVPKDAISRASIILKTKPRSNVIIQPPKKAISHIPSAKPAAKDNSGTRVHGLISAVASSISHQPKGTSELLTSASNFISGFGLSLASSSSNQLSTQKKS